MPAFLLVAAACYVLIMGCGIAARRSGARQHAAAPMAKAFTELRS